MTAGTQPTVDALTVLDAAERHALEDLQGKLDAAKGDARVTQALLTRAGDVLKDAVDRAGRNAAALSHEENHNERKQAAMEKRPVVRRLKTVQLLSSQRRVLHAFEQSPTAHLGRNLREAVEMKLRIAWE